jgi:hypothetical protein
MPNTHPLPASDSDFSEMDDAQISSHHWKIMFISGMGFFTDAYDLFIIGVVMTLLKPIWHVSPLATPGVNPLSETVFRRHSCCSV